MEGSRFFVLKFRIKITSSYGFLKKKFKELAVFHEKDGAQE
jgi:hypothetical protein